MILHMSRGFVLGVLSTVFAVGGLAGWLLRGPAGGALATNPALSRTDGPAPVELPAPKPAASRTQGTLRAVPTPGAYYRLGAGETLSDVAKRAYGTTKRLGDVLAANPTLDPKRLAQGTLLYVPLGIEAVPMPPTDLWKPEAPKAPPSRSEPPKSGKSPTKAPAPPAPVFSK